jgi:hypothetical protein
VFYDSTLFPPEYRGNFFFGDYNSNRVVRTTLAADGTVATVDAWGTDFIQAVDMDVGPDGALYVVGVTSGQVTRVMPEQVSQKLIVSGLNQRVVESGQGVFTVRLAQAPTADVTVAVQRASGDADCVGDGPCVNPEPDVPDERGCGCDAGAGGAAAWLAVVLFLRRRRT